MCYVVLILTVMWILRLVIGKRFIGSKVENEVIQRSSILIGPGLSLLLLLLVVVSQHWVQLSSSTQLGDLIVIHVRVSMLLTQGTKTAVLGYFNRYPPAKATSLDVIQIKL
jgi:hypothetical protein